MSQTKTTFKLNPDSDFIPLDKLLKLLSLVGSGGEAHIMIETKQVEVNGNIEIQKRKKMRAGDTATFNGTEIVIEA
jgi:ribosome-associated protein